jgi:hypothetical protein
MKAKPTPPVPVRRQARICFSIDWYATEAEADRAAAIVVAEGVTYNGGYFHGKPCGRDKNWDRDGLFAVTN